MSSANEAHQNGSVFNVNDLALGAAALRWAELGYAVHPLNARREPRTGHGFKDATRDPAKIRMWWSLWPDSNIGILRGAESDVVVVDVDPRNGGRLESLGFSLPETLTVRTGGGGEHLFFAFDDRLAGLPAKLDLAPGVELLIHSGYIVAAPSRHEAGNTYTIIAGDDVVQPPETLIELALSKATKINREVQATESPEPEIITDGRRNATLTSLAGTMRARGMAAPEIEAALIEVNRNRCDPPLPEREVSKIAAGMERYSPGKRKSQATRLVELALAARIKLFHAPDGSAYMRVQVGDHYEVLPLRGRAGRAWLQRRWYEAHASALPEATLSDARGVLEARAIFDGEQRPVDLRVGEGDDGAIWLDLGDDHWRAIKITPEGWSIQDNPPVMFRRPSGYVALPEPARGGTVAQIREFLNLPHDDNDTASDDGWHLFTAWLVAAMRPKGPYPPLIVHGGQGTGKSTLGRLCCELLDPKTAPLRGTPSNLRDLMVGARNNWVIALDNLSRLPGWLSDAICRLATGGGLGTRALYTDDEEHVIDAQRPVIVNSIAEIASRADLLDRAVILELPKIEKSQRRAERDFWGSFNQVRPQLLGALLDALSTTMGRLPEVHLRTLPRMADFARLGAACTQALGGQSYEFLRAYSRTARTGHQIAMEASLVGRLAIKIVTDNVPGRWEGTATTLLERMNGLASDREKRELPSAANSLSAELRRVAGDLEALGVKASFLKRKGSERLLVLEEAPCDDPGQVCDDQ